MYAYYTYIHISNMQYTYKLYIDMSLTHMLFLAPLSFQSYIGIYTYIAYIKMEKDMHLRYKFIDYDIEK